MPANDETEQTGAASLDAASAEQQGALSTRASSAAPEGEDVQSETRSILLVEGDTDMDEDEDPPDSEDVDGRASLYASSRFPRRLDPRPRVTIVGDSIMDEESIDLAASTRSLLQQYLDYNEENGRRYCGTYFMPNDEIEQTRLYLADQVYLHMFDGEPTTVPLTEPKLILDIGTGTGDWAIHIGERFPKCEVVGTDISAIQTGSPPWNVFFEIEDAELPWLWHPDTVDLVHMRNMTGAFRDWRFIYEQAYETLRPGGWLELQEFDDEDNWGKFLSAFPEDSPARLLARDVYLASIKSGRPQGIRHLDPKYLVEAGFVDIKTTEFTLPIAAKTGSTGQIWLMSVLDGIEAMCLRPLTKYMGWDPEECKRCCEETAHAIARMARDPEKAPALAIKVRVVTGRKPQSPSEASASLWDAYSAGASYLGSTSQVNLATETSSVMTSDTRTSVPEERTPVGSLLDVGPPVDEDDDDDEGDTVVEGSGNGVLPAHTDDLKGPEAERNTPSLPGEDMEICADNNPADPDSKQTRSVDNGLS